MLTDIWESIVGAVLFVAVMAIASEIYKRWRRP